MDKARDLPATADHPLDCGHLTIEERSRLRYLTQRVDYFRVGLHFFCDRIETGEMHGDERHLLDHRARAALGELTVVVRGHDLPVARVALVAYRIEAAHEFGGIYGVAELVDLSRRSCARRPASSRKTRYRQSPRAQLFLIREKRSRPRPILLRLR